MSQNKDVIRHLRHELAANFHPQDPDAVRVMAMLDELDPAPRPHLSDELAEYLAAVEQGEDDLEPGRIRYFTQAVKRLEEDAA